MSKTNLILIHISNCIARNISYRWLEFSANERRKLILNNLQMAKEIWIQYNDETEKFEDLKLR